MLSDEEILISWYKNRTQKDYINLWELASKIFGVDFKKDSVSLTLMKLTDPFQKGYVERRTMYLFDAILYNKNKTLYVLKSKQTYAGVSETLKIYIK